MRSRVPSEPVLFIMCAAHWCLLGPCGVHALWCVDSGPHAGVLHAACSDPGSGRRFISFQCVQAEPV